MFLYIKKKIEIEIKNRILFIKFLKKMKYISIYLTTHTEELYVENLSNLMKESKDLNK